MITKKIKAGLLCSCLATMLISTTAFAGTYTSGKSTGGVACNGSIAYHSSYITGTTNVSASDGIKAVHLKLKYSDGKVQNRDFSGYSTSVSGNANVDVSRHLYGVEGRHSYNSSKYGTWYGTTSY